jgi:hypothetical protein
MDLPRPAPEATTVRAAAPSIPIRADGRPGLVRGTRGIGRGLVGSFPGCAPPRPHRKSTRERGEDGDPARRSGTAAREGSPPWTDRMSCLALCNRPASDR